MNWSRRELLQSAGFLLAGSELASSADAQTQAVAAYEWIRNTRTLIAEAYNPPFYPSLDYEPAKAVKIARELNADSLRYPAASYYAYFPTKSGYPVHPELKADIMRQTVDQCHAAGLKTVAREVRTRGKAALALLERGLGGYAVRRGPGRVPPSRAS